MQRKSGEEPPAGPKPTLTLPAELLMYTLMFYTLAMVGPFKRIRTADIDRNSAIREYASALERLDKARASGNAKSIAIFEGATKAFRLVCVCAFVHAHVLLLKLVCVLYFFFATTAYRKEAELAVRSHFLMRVVCLSTGREGPIFWAFEALLSLLHRHYSKEHFAFVPVVIFDFCKLLLSLGT